MEPKTDQPDVKKNDPQFLRTDRGKTKSNAIEIPSITLPKGGGAIKGIDEKFSVNAVNGTASFSIPLPFTAARGASPTLSLSYNSGGGNSLFGLGWNLSLPSIKRKTDKGLPQYIDSIESDTFLFSEAEDLVPEFNKEPDGSFTMDSNGDYVLNEKDSPDGLHKIKSYRPRIEGLFARIERWTEKANGTIRWRVITKENVTTLLGWSSNSVIVDSKDSTKIFEWFPEFVFDDKGNCAQYIYKPEDEKGFDISLLSNRNRLVSGSITYANIYPEKILYGNKSPYKKFGDIFPGEADYLFSAVFDYGEYDNNSPYSKIKDWDYRTDSFSEYRPGFEIRTTRLCKRILFYHHFSGENEYDGLVKSMNFEYDTSTEKDFTFLKSITSFGYIKKPDGSYNSKNFPAAEFEYQQHAWNKDVKTISQEDLVNSPAGFDEQGYQFTDLFNEGLSGILTEQTNGWYYKHNLGDGKFEPAKLVTPKPSFIGLGNQMTLTDLDADGGKQLVSFGTDPKGFFELNDDNEWSGFRSFQSQPNLNFGDPNMRMLDLNGDGMPEVLISEDNLFTWYPSIGRNGYKAAQKTPRPVDEEAGPHILFSDEKQSIFLADMIGDGMTDIVRIRNGEVCYWPNLGYGKFGAKVSMDFAPVFDNPDEFNPSYLRLADIDGSGTTDIIYLGNNKFSCWLNYSGNSFTNTPFEIDAFPDIHNEAKITVTDILGNGVACIVWSSGLPKDQGSPLRYIDLMQSKKPHIMIFYKNNLGKEVSVEYTASTKFYIEDKLAGRPWITKLHFPVHCISKTEVRDKISGWSFVSTYKYHHGYYDHPEREFRGFGMIEQTDAENFENWAKGSASNIVDKELHQEPVVTKTWIHTGAFLRRDKILNQYENEYWYAEMNREGYAVVSHEASLPDAHIVPAPGIPTSVTDHLSTEEWQEALRACKSITIRSENFALDAPSTGTTPDEIKKQLTPFTVSTHNCTVELLQPKGKNKYAVFIVKESEAITYNYERNTDDPRIAHTLNIKLDEFGNILESASVVYPRMLPDASLPLVTQQEQAKTVIAYTQNQFTNDVDKIDIHRLRMPSETKSFELKGVSKTGFYYSLGDFQNILATSGEVPYPDVFGDPLPGNSQKRIIEDVRNIYYRNDLSAQLPLHSMESLALPFQNYQLAYTPDLITDIFSTKVNASLLTEGKFVHSENDNNWWIKSGSKQYIHGAETFADAQNRFYVPVSYTDPYDSQTTIQYYGNYFLFVQQTIDAVGNRTGVDLFNFRTLSAQRMRDFNNNLSEVISDELGMVKAMAVYGKGNEADDLTGLTEFTTSLEQSDIDTFFTTLLSTDLIVRAKNLLQHATNRFVYDFDVYKNTGKPVVSASITREEHFQHDNNSPVQLSFEYTNGMGTVIMNKVKTEPGLAKKVVVNPDNSFTVTDEDTSALNPKQVRWIGNGRTVLNNKGNAVKKYEPYFSVTYQYEDLKELVETGVTPIMYYDSLGRLIRTEMPDETFSYIEFDAWKQIVYDPNDSILNSPWYINRTNRLIDAELIAEGKDPGREKIAADKAAKHANTPTIYHFDTLGRSVLSIEHNKVITTNADVFLSTKIKIDVEGNLRTVTDARELLENANLGNTVIQFKYDMLGNIVYQNSMDGGQRWPLKDVIAKPLRTWDERNFEFQYFYDVIHRPLTAKIVGGDGPSLLDNIFDRVFYGEVELNPEVKNLRGKITRHYETGGAIFTPEYNFKGQPIFTTRRLFKNYKAVPNWIDANLNPDLEIQEFTFTTETDAIGRITQQTAPDGSVINQAYNEGGLLNSEIVSQINPANTVTTIKDIDYNEKGLRNKIILGNDVITRFYYDRETFRLNRIESKRQNNDPLQDWNYTFDPVGNITHIEDKNISVVFFDNQKVTGLSEYTYDALYNLAAATGRENDAALSFGNQDNWNDASYIHQMNPGDPMAVRNYSQLYEYDEVGNLKQMQHIAAGNNWTRIFEYEKITNRLKTTQIGVELYSYSHHPKHGFINVMPHLDEMGWNFKEELVKTVRQKVNPGNGTAETTYYQYDGMGKRIRKITENSAVQNAIPTKKEERIYISNYETYRKYQSNAINFERKSLSLMDEGHRFVMIETITQNTDPVPLPSEKVGLRLMRYQLYNHYGSATLELDAGAKVISYEEYHPFGTTAYQANNTAIKAAAKRYRYTGMERDDETGLEYHSARYYLPWLGRWLSVDSIGIEGGINDYVYCANNPINKTDTNGKEWCWNIFASDCEFDKPRIFGGLKMVGGALETVGGVAATIATAPACVSVVGCVIPVASGGVALHGVDTFVSGARSLWEGEAVDSVTSKYVLQKGLGVSRNKANLVDAGISVVGSLGTSAVTRAPGAAAAITEATEEGVTAAPSVTPSITVAFKPALGPGHNMVGVTTAEGTTWSHLVTDPQGISGLASTGQPAEIVFSTAGPSASYLKVVVPVTASEADAALNVVNNSVGAAGKYAFFGNDCATYASTVMNEAGVATPAVTSPFVNFTSAALQSPAVIQPVTMASTVVNTGVGVSSFVSSQDPGPVSVFDPAKTGGSSDSSYSDLSDSSEKQVCIAEPAVMDYSQMVCQQN